MPTMGCAAGAEGMAEGIEPIEPIEGAKFGTPMGSGLAAVFGPDICGTPRGVLPYMGFTAPPKSHPT